MILIPIFIARTPFCYANSRVIKGHSHSCTTHDLVIMYQNLRFRDLFINKVLRFEPIYLKSS